MLSLNMDTIKPTDLSKEKNEETKSKNKSEEYFKWAHLLAETVPLFLIKKRNSKFADEKWIVDSGRVKKEREKQLCFIKLDHSYCQHNIMKAISNDHTYSILFRLKSESSDSDMTSNPYDSFYGQNEDRLDSPECSDTEAITGVVQQSNNNSFDRQLEQPDNSYGSCVLASTETDKAEYPKAVTAIKNNSFDLQADNSFGLVVCDCSDISDTAECSEANTALNTLDNSDFSKTNRYSETAAESNDGFHLEATSVFEQFHGCPKTDAAIISTHINTATAKNTGVSFDRPPAEAVLEHKVTSEPHPVLSLKIKIETVKSDPDSKFWETEFEDLEPPQDVIDNSELVFQGDCDNAGLPNKFNPEAIKEETDAKETELQMIESLQADFQNGRTKTGVPIKSRCGERDLSFGNSSLQRIVKGELQSKDRLESVLTGKNIKSKGLPDEDSEIFDMVAKDLELYLKNVNKTEKADRWINPQSLSFLMDL